MQWFIFVNLHKFTVTVCEADCTTSTESDSTVCYDSDSSNRSVSSGPMFVEDDSDTDNNLPKIKPCSLLLFIVLLSLYSSSFNKEYFYNHLSYVF